MVCVPKKSDFPRILIAACRLFVLGVFLVTNVVPWGYAQEISLPKPGTMVGLSPSFAPVLLKGVAIHPEDPFLFDFIVDNGQSALKGESLTRETTRLVRYFLSGLAIPEKDLWVNLSPVEQGRVMTGPLSQTEAGRDMLAQDYILKQVTASLVYPEADLGRTFWDEVYRRTYQELGHTDIPLETFNKVWIVPEEATVYQDGNRAVIATAHLKVMLEADYLAADQDAVRAVEGSSLDATEEGVSSVGRQGSRTPLSQEMARKTFRDVIIPVLEEEVNEGANFASLRQLFHSLILAGWYKNALQQALINQVYGASGKVEGISIDDKNVREKVYARYLQAYQKGVYDYVKEETDRKTGEVIAKKYFSGGIEAAMMVRPRIVSPQEASPSDRAASRRMNGDAAMISYRMQRLGAALSRPSAMSGRYRKELARRKALQQKKNLVMPRQRILSEIMKQRALFSARNPDDRKKLKDMALRNRWYLSFSGAWIHRTGQIYLEDAKTGRFFVIDGMSAMPREVMVSNRDFLPSKKVVWDEFLAEDAVLRMDLDRVEREIPTYSPERLGRLLEQIRFYQDSFRPAMAAARDRRSRIERAIEKEIERALASSKNPRQWSERIHAAIDRLREEEEDPEIRQLLHFRSLKSGEESVDGMLERIKWGALDFPGSATYLRLGAMHSRVLALLGEADRRKTYRRIAIGTAIATAAGGALVWAALRQEVPPPGDIGAPSPFALSSFVLGVAPPAVSNVPAEHQGPAERAQARELLEWWGKLVAWWNGEGDGSDEGSSLREGRPVFTQPKWVGQVTLSAPVRGPFSITVVQSDPQVTVVKVTLGKREALFQDQDGVMAVVFRGQTLFRKESVAVTDADVRQVMAHLQEMPDVPERPKAHEDPLQEELLAVNFTPQIVGSHRLRFLRDSQASRSVFLWDDAAAGAVPFSIKKVFRFGDMFICFGGQENDKLQVLGPSADGTKMVPLSVAGWRQFLNLPADVFDAMFSVSDEAPGVLADIEWDATPKHLFLLRKDARIPMKYSVDLRDLQDFMREASARSEPAQALTQGGIDLGGGQYLRVIATDQAGMPAFDPSQIRQLREDLRGLRPVPVGAPRAVDVPLLLGLRSDKAEKSSAL